MRDVPPSKPLWDPTERVTTSIVRRWMAQGRQHHEGGRLAEAESAYRQVLGMNAAHAEANFRLANVLREQGRRDEARRFYDAAIGLEPVEAHYHLARILFHEKDAAGALEHLRTVLGRDPEHAQAHRLAGMVLQSLGRAGEAVEHYRTALRLRPELIAVNLNLGVALQQLGRGDEAVRLYRDVLARHPGYGEMHANLGAALAARGEHQAAISHYERALENNPGEPLLLYNMGNALYRMERYDQAIACYTTAVRHNPDLVEAHFNLGNAYRDLGRLAEAHAAYAQALERFPGHREARTNLGTVLVRERRFEEAEAAFRDAIARAPDDPMPHWMLGQLRLLQGDFETGWAEFAWVERLDGAAPRAPELPRWDGGALAGRRLHAYAEASYGIGDEIMFATCLPELVGEAAACLIECDARLVNLMRRAMPDAVVRARGQAGVLDGNWDVQTSMSAAVRLRRRRPQDFSTPGPCLAPDEAACRRWRERLTALGRPLKVGIAWHGGASFRERRERSVDLRHWSGILAVDAAAFVNLQHGPARAQAAAHHDRIADWHEVDPHARFDDYAALIASLDLVVSVDCTAAHLAGALGVPTWLMVPHVPNWRWLDAGASSPWYPGVRVYRQAAWDDWAGVLASVRDDLAVLAARKAREAGEVGAHGTAALFEQALRHHGAGELLEAAARYRDLLRIEPDHAEAHHNLAGVLQQQGWLREAAAELEAALALRPDYAEAHYNLGNLLHRQGRPREAVRRYRRAVALRPDLARAHNNLASVLKELGEFQAAREHYDRAVELDPGDNDARFNRATLLLLQGALAEGWREHESRLRRDDLGHRTFPAPFPPWDGSPLAGRSILVYAEQGIGDEIMYASCLPDLLGQAARCVVQCDPRLESLFARSFPAAQIVGAPRQEDAAVIARLGRIDVQVAAGSLPLHFRSGLEDFPRVPGYLVPDPQRTEAWRRRCAALPQRLRVGISWKSLGDVREREARTIALERWRPVLAVPGVSFVNVQYGPTEEDVHAARAASGVTVHDWDGTDRFADLEGLAAQLAALDLVISIDNSTVHMAGAVGTPVWVMLPYVPDWRWMLERSDTPWYPRTRVVRQARPGEWDAVLERVADALRGWVHDRS